MEDVRPRAEASAHAARLEVKQPIRLTSCLRRRTRHPNGGAKDLEDGAEFRQKPNLTMLNSKLVLTLACAAIATTLFGAEPGTKKPRLLKGPAKAHLGTIAQIDVPVGYIFIDGKDYQAILESEGEPVNGRELGYLSPTNEHWSVVFSFSDIGYVKDDEKDKLSADADKILNQIKQGTAEANKQRVRAGHSPVEVVGWELPPKYDETTHNLEWAIRGSVDGQPLLNYNT